jgi:hypothetical protein
MNVENTVHVSGFHVTWGVENVRSFLANQHARFSRVSCPKVLICRFISYYSKYDIESNDK